jgi:hypothetical protein
MGSEGGNKIGGRCTDYRASIRKLICVFSHSLFYMNYEPCGKQKASQAMINEDYAKWCLARSCATDPRETGLRRFLQNYDFRTQLPLLAQLLVALTGFEIHVRSAEMLEHASDHESDIATTFFALTLYGFHS